MKWPQIHDQWAHLDILKFSFIYCHILKAIRFVFIKVEQFLWKIPINWMIRMIITKYIWSNKICITAKSKTSDRYDELEISDLIQILSLWTNWENVIVSTVQFALLRELIWILDKRNGNNFRFGYSGYWTPEWAL